MDHFTLNIDEGETEILVNTKRAAITATKNHFNIEGFKLDINVLEFLLKKHKEVFDDKGIRIIQSI